jgi:DNA-binding NarL/FixJ family response regulator
MPDFKAEPLTAGSVFRVLLIEAERTEGRRLRAVLEHCYGQPFLLTETGSLEQGFEALQTKSFHLLVLDHGIMNWNGRGDFRLLREMAPTTPIILQVRYRTRQVVADAVRVGAEAVLIKGEPHRLWQALLQVTRCMGNGEAPEPD